MTQTMDHDEARMSLGVYVLGAIDPAERSMVDAHLTTCRDCRDELAGLAGLPALLARVSAAEALALAEADGPPGEDEAAEAVPETREAPRELLATVLDLTAARRRRRRWREAALAVAAALIIAAGVFGGLRLGGGPARSGPAIADQHDNVGPASGPWHTAAASAQGMTATVAYRPTGWGTQLAVKVNGIPVGTRCELWVVGKDGSRTLSGGWVIDENEGTVWYPASAATSAVAVHSFLITVGAQRPKTITVTV